MLEFEASACSRNLVCKWMASIVTFIDSIFSFADIFYMSVVLNDGHYQIYRFLNAEKPDANPWQSLLPGYFEDLYALVPFNFNQKLYLFVLSKVDAVRNGAIDGNSSLDSYPILTLYY